jgi:hypothetical protein
MQGSGGGCRVRCRQPSAAVSDQRCVCISVTNEIVGASCGRPRRTTSHACFEVSHSIASALRLSCSLLREERWADMIRAGWPLLWRAVGAQKRNPEKTADVVVVSPRATAARPYDLERSRHGWTGIPYCCGLASGSLRTSGRERGLTRPVQSRGVPLIPCRSVSATVVAA